MAKNKFILNGTGTVLYTDPNYLASFIEGDIQNDISITDYSLDPELGELNINKIRAQELLYLDHDTLRKEIKTLPDLIYFLYYNHFTSMNGDIALYDNSDTYWHYNRDPYKILKDLNGNCGGYANLTKYLLGDDYEIGNLQMTFDDSNAGGHVINYIKVNNNYYVLDISNLVSNNYKPKGLNLYKTADLQDFASFILTRNSSINLIYEGTYLDGYDFPINWESTCKTTYLPLGFKYTILFSQKDYSIALKKMDMTLNRYGAPVRAYSISNINLNENPLINELGNPKLSQNQLEELSTRTIEEVAAKITTLADLLNLMYLRGMINYENDLKYYISESNVWQFNRNAKTVYQSNFGDCGGLANLTNYVLKGDYQSNGFVNYTFEIGKGGGHVTNYIKYNDKYYFFDMTSWFGRGYAPASFEIYKYDQISDYATKASYFFANITMNMCTYEAENDMPVNWKDLSNGVTAYESGYTINEILSKSNYKFSPITLGPNDLYKINYRR